MIYANLSAEGRTLMGSSVVSGGLFQDRKHFTLFDSKPYWPQWAPFGDCHFYP